MQKVKVTISTLGPLHLIKSAEYLSQIVDVTVVQGWIPTWWNSWGLKLASKIAKYDLEHTFKKRTPSCLNGKNHGCFLPEFFLGSLELLHQKFRFLIRLDVFPRTVHSISW